MCVVLETDVLSRQGSCGCQSYGHIIPSLVLGSHIPPWPFSMQAGQEYTAAVGWMDGKATGVVPGENTNVAARPRQQRRATWPCACAGRRTSHGRSCSSTGASHWERRGHSSRSGADVSVAMPVGRSWRGHACPPSSRTTGQPLGAAGRAGRLRGDRMPPCRVYPSLMPVGPVASPAVLHACAVGCVSTTVLRFDGGAAFGIRGRSGTRSEASRNEEFRGQREVWSRDGFGLEPAHRQAIISTQAKE